MPKALHERLVSLRELALASGPFALIGVALLAAAYWILDPTPPRRVVLASGPENSAYGEFGRRFAAELARSNIRVELRHTSGSRDNLRLLREAKEVDLAFVQGGSSDASRLADETLREAPLVSLGALFYEPVWLFYRRDAALTHLSQLKGWRVNVGARGSGTPGLVRKLLDANHVEREELVRTNLDESGAVLALLEGELDAAVLVSAPESPMVQMLLQTPGIRLYEFVHAQAYSRRYPFLAPVTLHRGVADLARDVPARDIALVATTTSLIARESIHPALVQLFVQAASRIHGEAGWIAPAGRFPNAEHGEFPLARDAERYYRSGPPLLQRYLPFWLANLVDRMWVALVSIIAVLIPLSRLVPPLYQFRVRSRVFRWYRHLRQIETQLERKSASREELLAALDALEARACRIAVPLSYADELYALRAHIDLVRERLKPSPPGQT
jgi:TRAP transporter TAXI family solute receptor